MTTLTDKDKKSLLKLARSAIASDLNTGTPLEMPDHPSPAVKEKRGCFVTLHKRGVLRGCIGIIEPMKPLMKGVEENAVNAAFRDPRFPPLQIDEFNDVDIEISVLTSPEPLDFKNPEDLKQKLKPGVHGVILSKGWHRSTFLPQVWEQLPDPEDFLSHLCQKAGMKKDCWRDKNIEVKVYQVEYFSEDLPSH
jgi:AmmeMemoRadiSam system protein A